MGQQFDPSKPFTVAPAPTIGTLSPDQANESVADAQTRGFKEGVVGGAKGFVEGMLQSPASFAKGIVSLLTTNPVTSVKDAVAAIERLPDAIRASGADPEGWGKSVGDLTGQTMIGAVAPRAVAAGARGVAGAAGAMADAVQSPLAARVAPKLVKYGTAAAGGAVGGWPGAIVGREVGADLAEGLKARLTAKASALTPAETALVEGLSTGEPMPAAKFMELLQQVPPDHRAAIMEARQAAVQAGQAGGAAPSPVAPAAAEAPPAAAPPAPSAAPMPAPQSAPAAAPQAAPSTQPGVPMSRPAAMQAALKAFSEAQETPRPAEVSNAAALIAKGTAPEQALKVVVGNRPTGTPAAPTAELSPAEAFNAKYGLAQPTVDQTKFPKGQRGAVGSAQSVTVPPEETPTPQELLQGGAAEADFARQYAAKQSAVDPYATTGYEDVPSHLVRSVKLSPTEEYALHWIKQDMESVPFTKHTWVDQTTIEGPVRGNAAGGKYDIVPGSAGAPIYQEIVGDVTGATRADVLKAIENLQQGKMTKLGELVLQKAKEVSNMTEAQLKKRFLTGPPHFSEISR